MTSSTVIQTGRPHVRLADEPHGEGHAPPLVTIGLPSYNRPDGLAQLLEDLTAQTCRDLEIVISDNCSPDPRVQEIALAWARRDPRIRVFRQDENLGAIANHQFVMDQARGRYFMWAHDDDRFPKNYLEICLSHFQSNPDVVLVGPSCDRHFDGKFMSAYETWDSVGQRAFQRLRELIPDGFTYHWRFEQYLSGLCRRSAMPARVSPDFKSQFAFFFAMSARGELRHASELRLVKHTTDEHIQKYQNNANVSATAGSTYRRHRILRWLTQDMQECVPVTLGMMAVVLGCPELTPAEKAALVGRCLSLFVGGPVRNELRARLGPLRPVVRALRRRPGTGAA